MPADPVSFKTIEKYVWLSPARRWFGSLLKIKLVGNPISLPSVVRYLLGLLLVLLATAINMPLLGKIAPTNFVIAYLLAVTLAATYLGRGPAILVSFVGVLAFDFLFVPPRFTFSVDDEEYVITFIGFLGVALVISQLTAMVQAEVQAAQRRTAETLALYSLSRDLAIASDLHAILHAITTNISLTFDSEAHVFLPKQSNEPGLSIYPLESGMILETEDLAAALEAFKTARETGHGTLIYPEAVIRCLPMITPHGVEGILGVKPKRMDYAFSPDQHRLLEAFTSQAALAIARVQLADQARQGQILKETEKLQSALLNSISHDLRTPLVSIRGALSMLQDTGKWLEEKDRASLLETASEEADRLNSLVGDLLNITRIEAGALHMNRQPADIQDLIGSALDQASRRIGNRQIMINLAENLPPVSMDFVLIVHVLFNLIDNALKYSPPDRPVEICARLVADEVQVSVSDHGSGIPAGDLERVFDKFYRVAYTDRSLKAQRAHGTGLGLSICKGILEVHRGHIWAENRPEGGASISFALPVESE